jgi:hypothetical protein
MPLAITGLLTDDYIPKCRGLFRLRAFTDSRQPIRLVRPVFATHLCGPSDEADTQEGV